MIVSLTFKQLYINPVKIFVEDLFDNLVRSWSFSFVIYGIRYGTRICYSISTFSLTFKLLHYLDNEIENKDEEDDFRANASHADNNNNNNANTNFDMNLSSSDGVINPLEDISKNTDLLVLEDKNDNLISLTVDIYNKHRKQITFKIMRKFLMRQVYKYIMFIICVFHFKFSQFEPFLLYSNPGPVWLYFKDAIIDKFSFSHVISNLLLYSPFSNTTFNYLDPFNMIYNEIAFFLICGLIVYFSFIKNLRLDKFLLFSFLIVIIIKLCLFLSLHFMCNKDKFYPSMLYQNSNKIFILSNPLYNINSALIRVFFSTKTTPYKTLQKTSE